MPGLDPGIHPSSQEDFVQDGLPEAQTSLRSLRKADCYAGNDDIMLFQNRVTISESAGRGRSSLGFDGVPM